MVSSSFLGRAAPPSRLPFSSRITESVLGRPAPGEPSILQGITTQPSLLRGEVTPPSAFPSLITPSREFPSPPSRIPRRDVPPGTPPSRRRFFLRFEKERQLRRAQPGYNTFLRKGEKRGDKFVIIARNLPPNRAVARGAFAADNFIEASFLTKLSGKKTRQTDIPPPDLSKKFRGIRPGSKLPGRTIVERKGKRLDKLNEVLQISFFKQQALKNQISGQVRQPKRTTIRSPLRNTARVGRFL